MELKIINFGIELSDKVFWQIEQTNEVTIDGLDIKVQINMNKNVYIQIVDIVDTIPETFLYSDNLVINPPALAIAAVYLVNEIEARSNKKPYILELKRDRKRGVYTPFEYSRIRNLQLETAYSKNKKQKT